MSPLPRITILRDATLVAMTGAAFAIDAFTRPNPGRLATAVGVTAGVLGAVSGFLLHEWGHLAGALATGSFVHYPNKLLAPLLFHFDTQRNTRHQFLWMSYGGYAASVLGVAAILGFAPLDSHSGHTALTLAGLGMLVTFALEIPTTVRVLLGSDLPEGYAFRPPT